MDFCAQLKKLHTGSGLTQRALATRLHMSEAQLSAILNGKIAKPPSWGTVENIVIACQWRDRPVEITPTDRARLLARWRSRYADLEDAVQRRRQQPRTAAGAVRPAAVNVPEVRYSLPPDTAAFTGRQAELGHVMASLTGTAPGGVVPIGAIGGMPGVGKTTLAVHAAHLLRTRYPDRQIFVDLHGHTPGLAPLRAEEVLAGLLAAVGVDSRYLPGDLAGRAGMWRDKMTGQRALLVLDNAASSGQVTPLLPGGGDCLVLVTSRRYLGDLPGAVTPVLLDTLPPPQAQELFRRLAPRAAGDPGQVAELVSLAGFLPLAISLLARVFTRHPAWTLADLAAETRAGVLALTAENASVAAAFEVSYRHLAPAQQRLFSLLGLHPGDTTDPWAAAALAATSLGEATGLLDGLHAEGLLTETGYRRYGMHDLLRRYARDCAAASPADGSQALERLLDYYQHTAERAEVLLARQTRPGLLPSATPPPVAPALDDTEQALVWARANRASLLACLDHATRAGQHARVVALTAALTALWRIDGPWADTITRHTAAIEAARHLGDQLSEADALTNLGGARQLTGDYMSAAQDLQQALGIYCHVEEELGEANALTYLGLVQGLTDDYPRAAQSLNQALDLYHDLGNQLGQAITLTHLGLVRRLAGDSPGAAQSLKQALGIYRGLGDRLGEANALSYLWDVWQLTGDYPGAAQALEQALHIYRDLGNQLGEANTLFDLGYLRRLTGDYPGAAQALEQALCTYRSLGNRNGEANAVSELGVLRRTTGDCSGAAQALEQALGIYRDLGNRSGVSQTINEIGTLHQVSGDPARAEECHRQAREIARAIASCWDEAHALAGLGRCALATGRAGQGQDLLRQAHEIFQRIGAAEAHTVLAELAALTCPDSREAVSLGGE